MNFDHFFYSPDLNSSIITLSEDESEHCCRALRHRVGDKVQLTDGKGTVASVTILNDHPKACMVEMEERHLVNDKGTIRLHLAIAPTKNNDRIEWLVEKCVEIGIETISFIFCENSERPRVNLDRLHRIAVSALKQCQTTWLPPMESLPFKDFLEKSQKLPADRYMAWCDDQNTRQLAFEDFQHEDVILLVGPEGDFSPAEIELARTMGYVEVKIGNRRLRTETAGLYGCLLMAARGLR